MIQYKKIRNACIFAAVFISFLQYSCNPIDSVGSDLGNGDWVNLKGVDTFSFSMEIAPNDSIKTFENQSLLSNFTDASSPFPLGKIEDPIFGKMSAGIATQLSFVPQKDSSFQYNHVDSVILSLRYDTSFFYGNTSAPFSFSVYTLDVALEPNKTYFTNNFNPVLTSSNKIGELVNVVPNGRDTISIWEDTSIVKALPQLRIPLDTFKFMSLIRSYPDSVFLSVTDFQNIFKGIAITVDEAKGFISVLPENIISKITIYYKKDSAGAQARFEFNMNRLVPKVPLYEQDNTGTISQLYLSGTISPDSLFFIQPMLGRDARLKMPHNPLWESKFLNHAVLEFNVVALPGDDLSAYQPCDFLQLYDYSTMKRVGIDDVLVNFGTGSLNSFQRNFGGVPIKVNINGQEIWQYKMNITRHFQNSVRAKKDLDLIISPLYKLESPARVVLYGNKHSTYPAKLRLSFSD